MNKRPTVLAPQRRTYVVVIALLTLLLVLAACSQERSPETAPAQPTAAALAQQPAAAAATPEATATLTPTAEPTATPTATAIPTATPTPTATPIFPLSIEYLRQQDYSGSELVIEQTLAAGSNYDRYYASYFSEGLKQYGLLTVPRGQRPESGWPVIIFNHGYIPPSQYKTTERYVAYVDGFASSGYIVFRPDYRGHDRSEGQPTGAYGSPDYVIDVLNATGALKRYPDADPERIGMWGHSMGGWITLRAMVVDPDIQAGVIWGGVVGAYEDLLTGWRRGNRPTPTPNPTSTRGRWRNSLTSQFGSPEDNPEFWQYTLSQLLSGRPVRADPVASHHGRRDCAGGVLADSLRAGPGGRHAHRARDLPRRQPQHLRQLRRSHEPVGGLLRPLGEAAHRPGRGRGAGRLHRQRPGQPAQPAQGPSFAIVGQMQSGESLPLLGSNVDRTWWQVQTTNGPAWVADSVVLAARFAGVPVVEDAAGP